MIKLTKRQNEVLRHIGDCLSTIQIAKKMNLSPKTIESHRMELMVRTKRFNIGLLVKLAIRQGLTTL